MVGAFQYCMAARVFSKFVIVISFLTHSILLVQIYEKIITQYCYFVNTIVDLSLCFMIFYYQEALMYKVYAGLYENMKESKSVSRKLEKIGLSSYMFSKNGKIALMAGAFVKETDADAVKKCLVSSGITAFIENGA